MGGVVSAPRRTESNSLDSMPIIRRLKNSHEVRGGHAEPKTWKDLTERARKGSIDLGPPAKIDRVIYLERGGKHITTQNGTVMQYCCPPHSIKDCMTQGLPVPDIYIVPQKIFNEKEGISLHEFEFPCYFNFFILKRKVKIITFESVKKRIKTVLRESLLGPAHFELEKEFLPAYSDLMPDLEWEGRSVRDAGLTADALVDFIIFEEMKKSADVPEEVKRSCSSQGKVDYLRINKTTSGEEKITMFATINKDVRIWFHPLSEEALLKNSNSTGWEYSIFENGRFVTNADESYGLNIDENRGERAKLNMFGRKSFSPGSGAISRSLSVSTVSSEENVQVFHPPDFGITVLGSSHGFDAAGRTTGFIVWINRFGICVDPPMNTTKILESLGISQKLITGLVLTHCHADHDAGIMQMLLSEMSLNLYATRTILGSFLRKHTAITEMSQTFLLSLFKWTEVYPHAPILCNGGTLTFHYALHTIPTTGFVAEYAGKTFAYSADHKNDPDWILNLWNNEQKEYGLDMTLQINYRGRRNFLLSFPFGYREDIATIIKEEDFQLREEMQKNETKSPIVESRKNPQSDPAQSAFVQEVERNMKCNFDLVFHELGVPPIHTPGETLAALPEDSRNKLRVVHVGKSLCPEGLLTGIEGETIDLECNEEKIPREAETLRKLMFLSNVQFFQEVSFKDSHRIVQMVETVRFNQGEDIVIQGDVATHFYVVIKGRVSRRRQSHWILRDRIIERMLTCPDNKEVTKLEYLTRILKENPHFTVRMAIEKVEYTYGAIPTATIEFLLKRPEDDIEDDIVDYNEIEALHDVGEYFGEDCLFQASIFYQLNDGISDDEAGRTSTRVATKKPTQMPGDSFLRDMARVACEVQGKRTHYRDVIMKARKHNTTIRNLNRTNSSFTARTLNRFKLGSSKQFMNEKSGRGSIGDVKHKDEESHFQEATDKLFQMTTIRVESKQVECLRIEKAGLLTLIQRSTDLVTELNKFASNRRTFLEFVQSSKHFGVFTVMQIIFFGSRIRYVKNVQHGSVVWQAGDTGDEAVMLHMGTMVYGNIEYEKGTSFFDTDNLLEGKPHEKDLIVNVTPCSYFTIDVESLLDVLSRFPGILMMILHEDCLL